MDDDIGQSTLLKRERSSLDRSIGVTSQRRRTSAPGERRKHRIKRDQIQERKREAATAAASVSQHSASHR